MSPLYTFKNIDKGNVSHNHTVQADIKVHSEQEE